MGHVGLCAAISVLPLASFGETRLCRLKAGMTPSFGLGAMAPWVNRLTLRSDHRSGIIGVDYKILLDGTLKVGFDPLRH